MDPKNELIHEKSKLLKEISLAAQRGDSREVLVGGEKLRKIEDLIIKCENLLRDISDLSTANLTIQPSLLEDRKSETGKDVRPAETAGRGIGRTIRQNFLKKASENELHLKHIKGSIYATQSRNKVGIAVATERNSGRWFLGLPLDGFDHAVLLCKPDLGEAVEICLPKSFFDGYGDKMSRSSGQMKFNIARRGSEYAILVPGTDGVSVSKFIGNLSLLK